MVNYIKKGLKLPLAGAPTTDIVEGPKITKVAVTGFDYHGMRPRMLVKVGDVVKAGQVLFSCKKTEGVIHTSPASGKIIEINRGERRAFESVVIEVSNSKQQVKFSNYKSKGIKDLSRDEVQSLLIESGLWTSLRTRPFSKTPPLSQIPKSIFITAIDTNPLAGDVSTIINEHAEDFRDGVEIISKLTDGKTYLCQKEGENIQSPKTTKVEVKNFEGIHPAGNVGTHIHLIDSVSFSGVVHHIGYQDVIAVGKLFKTGLLFNERIISLGGPRVLTPSLIRTVVGADLKELTEGQVASGEVRIISGSVFSGRKMEGSFSYLGKFHQQISILEEGRKREFFGWQVPGFRKFSVKRSFLHWLIPNQIFELDTTTHGSHRAMVPIGSFEQVMPLDLLPTQLLRALVSNDLETALELGCLELDEEDLSLCTFVAPGKVDFGEILRKNLTIIEKEG